MDDDKHGPLPQVLMLLTFVTGVVDAVSYLKLDHVFVANMTGNVVFLVLALLIAAGIMAQRLAASDATWTVGPPRAS